MAELSYPLRNGRYVLNEGGYASEIYTDGVRLASDTTLYKVDINGEQQWSYSFSNTIQDIAIDDVGGTIVAVNGDATKISRFGHEKFTISTGDTIEKVGYDGSGNIYVGDIALKKYSSDGGSQRWSLDDNSGGIDGIGVGTNHVYYTDSEVLLKVDLQGNVVWRKNISLDVRYVAVSRNGIFVTEDSNLHYYDKSGTRQWSNSLSSNPVFLSADGDHCYLTLYSGDYDSAKIDTSGNTVWTCSGGYAISPYSDGSVFASDFGKFYRYDSNGNELWSNGIPNSSDISLAAHPTYGAFGYLW